MTRYMTDADLIGTIPALTSDRLVEFLRLQIVVPITTDQGPRYREIDVSRVTFLCELCDDLDMNEDSLVIIMSLLDQLHGARAQVARVMDSVAAEKAEIRNRIASRLFD